MIENLNAANTIVHFMEDVKNHNKSYPKKAVSLLLHQVQCNSQDMDYDQLIILIAHRVRSIIKSNPSLRKSYKKYENAANKIIHHLDFKNSPKNQKYPRDCKEKLLKLFETHVN